MGMTTTELLKTVYNKLDDEPLGAGDPRYIPIYEESGYKDPMKRLEKHIELVDDEKIKNGKSVQFFTGFRGCGKTTALFRLKQCLEEKYYFVIYVDGLEYINPAEEIDITDLLVVLAGAFSDALRDHPQIKANIQIESYWTRFKNFLFKTEAEITEINAKTKLDFMGMAGTEAGIKMNLKSTPTFRQELQNLLKTRIGELKQNVDEFMKDGVRAIRSALGPETQIVFIFDSLEQLRGSLLNEEKIIRSVVDVFTIHHRLLELPDIHTIVTVPPWLKFVTMLDNTKPIILLHGIKQWVNDAARTPHKDGNNVFRNLILKRLGKDGFKTLFGEEWNAERTKADDLIEMCGGDIRIILRLVRDIISSSENFPISDDEIKAVITTVKSDFLPISDKDAMWLSKIEKNREVSLPDVKGEYVGGLTRFFDRNWVLYFRNGEDWYDIHPFIQSEIQKIVNRIASEKETEDKNNGN
jgi:hypothetical protein